MSTFLPAMREMCVDVYRWTNFGDVDGKTISVPKTAHTVKKETNIPLTALNAVKGTHLRSTV